MVDVRSKRCGDSGCTKRPSFGEECKSTAKHCGHRKSRDGQRRQQKVRRPYMFQKIQIREVLTLDQTRLIYSKLPGTLQWFQSSRRPRRIRYAATRLRSQKNQFGVIQEAPCFRFAAWRRHGFVDCHAPPILSSSSGYYFIVVGDAAMDMSTTSHGPA